MRIELATLKELEPYRQEARREGGFITEGKTPIRWYKAIDEEGRFVGCVGLLEAGKKGNVRVRGWFTPSTARGKGYGGILLMFAVEEARALGFKTIECRTRHYGLCHHVMPGFWTRGEGGPWYDGAVQLWGNLERMR